MRRLAAGTYVCSFTELDNMYITTKEGKKEGRAKNQPHIGRHDLAASCGILFYVYRWKVFIDSNSLH